MGAGAASSRVPTSREFVPSSVKYMAERIVVARLARGSRGAPSVQKWTCLYEHDAEHCNWMWSLRVRSLSEVCSRHVSDHV